jgi:ectoine hydroxylase-related dioxygenase (phytanoyl-CoA dioxygenase family)
MVEITEKDVVSFEKDGVIKIKGFIPVNQVGELDRAITPYLARSKLLNKLISGDSLFFSKPNVWKTDPYFLQFVQQPMFIDLAIKLLRSNRINLLQDVIFVKSANSRQKFAWHHDLIYAPIHGKMVVSFWMATKTVTLHHGGIQFIKGSHRWTENFGPPPSLAPISKVFPQYWRKYLPGKKSNLSPRAVEDSDRYSKDAIVSFDLEQGDLLAFHGEIQHRSGPNWADKIDRKGYTIRYTGDDIKYHPHPDTGIAFQLWNPKLDAGEKMGGPLFPLLYENGQYLELESDVSKKGRMWRIFQNKISALRSKSDSDSSQNQKARENRL